MSTDPSFQREFVARGSATGQVNPVGFHPCQGIYYTPPDQRPKTAFIATHFNVDFSEHYLGPMMAERGFGFLGWNTRFRGNEGFFLLEHALIDIGVGVKWLREQGIEYVVLLEQFIADEIRAGTIHAEFESSHRAALVHGHCHQHAFGRHGVGCDGEGHLAIIRNGQRRC